MLSVLAFTIGVASVPMFPYMPRCYEQHEPTSVGSIFLDSPYREALVDSLSLYGVPHLEVDGLVLLRFWYWLVDPVSWVANASNQAVRYFVDEKYWTSSRSLPPNIAILVERARQPDGYTELECSLVRAVAIEGW